MRLRFYFWPLLLLALPRCSSGQRVDYSDFLPRRSGDQFLFAGQAGRFFWIEKDNFNRRPRGSASGDLPRRQFVLLNDHLQQSAIFDAPESAFEKIYLVPGAQYFDQLAIRRSGGKTLFELTRLAADGSGYPGVSFPDSLAYAANPGQILLCRSADRNRILLMAFENLSDESTRVHTTLFDRDWHVLRRNQWLNPGFSQPCIQDDLIGLPGESFDNLPLKAGNGGDWLMTSVSTRSGRFVLVHGCAEAGSFSMHEMPLNPFFQMEDVAMNIDETKSECSIGLLSRYRRTSIKNVRVSRYDLNGDRFIFDSAFHFNSLAGRLHNPNLVNESFVGIPGGGFMLFKEYGRAGVAPASIQPEEEAAPGDPFLFSTLFSGGAPAPSLKEDAYLKKPGLQGMRSEFGRGNLSMFYFPSLSGDSSWTGLINTFQQTELNKPSLSYLVLTHEAKIYLLYHAGQYGYTEPGTTTTLDYQGKETGDAVIFWKLNRSLDFQQAIRFSEDQVAVPFQNNQQPGFAIIRLH